MVSVIGSYNFQLVALSILVACLASYAALSLAARTPNLTGRSKLPSVLIGAVLMGFGIWAMHFIAMLAFNLPVIVRYDAPITVLSWVAAVVASAFALLVIGRAAPSRGHVISGGALMGLSIIAMHYLGMSAMRFRGEVHYQVPGVLLSILVAFLASTAAVYLAVRVREAPRVYHERFRLTGALLLGLAIAGMHYTGMHAAHFNVHEAHQGSALGLHSQYLSNSFLAQALTATAVLLLGGTLWTLVMNERGALQAARAEEARRLNEELEQRVEARTRELHARQLHLDALIQNLPVILFALDRHGTIELVEGKGLDTLGVPAARLVGSSVFELYAASPDTLRTVRRALAGEYVQAEHVLEHRVLETRYSPILDARGEQTGVVGVAVDVTERRAVEAALQASNVELRQSNEELERFAYVASHDLQTPLRNITTFTELLERRLDSALDDRSRAYMRHVTGGALRMKSLIDDLLAFSRVHSQRLTPGPVNAEEVLQVVLRGMEGELASAGMSVTHDPLPWVLADPTRLHQVLQNLLGNAVKYHRPGVTPAVRISVTPAEGSTWRFSVSDNGIGIEQQYLERIFNVFERLHRSDEIPGSGVGLAVCKKIIEQYGGRIWVESTPGAGSVFSFTLPACADPALSAHEARPAQVPLSAAPPAIPRQEAPELTPTVPDPSLT